MDECDYLLHDSMLYAQTPDFQVQKVSTKYFLADIIKISLCKSS